MEKRKGGMEEKSHFIPRSVHRRRVLSVHVFLFFLQPGSIDVTSYRGTGSEAMLTRQKGEIGWGVGSG